MTANLSERLDLPLRKGLPGWMGIVTMFMVAIPVMMINGTYTGSLQEVSGTLGALTEDITMGYYAASAGMAIVYPILNKVMDRVTQKTLLLISLSLQVVISWMCAKTRSTDLLIAYSFILGFVKGFAMLWFVKKLSKLVSPRNIRSQNKWVTANYRETQIENIYIGQRVIISVDAVSGRTFEGRVTAISEATGSKYSLVPTDNSAGNFVKVQQRIPVRIDFVDVSPDDMDRFRAGMMVVT